MCEVNLNGWTTTTTTATSSSASPTAAVRGGWLEALVATADMKAATVAPTGESQQNGKEQAAYMNGRRRSSISSGGGGSSGSSSTFWARKRAKRIQRIFERRMEPKTEVGAERRMRTRSLSGSKPAENETSSSSKPADTMSPTSEPAHQARSADWRLKGPGDSKPEPEEHQQPAAKRRGPGRPRKVPTLAAGQNHNHQQVYQEQALHFRQQHAEPMNLSRVLGSLNEEQLRRFHHQSSAIMLGPTITHGRSIEPAGDSPQQQQLAALASAAAAVVANQQTGQFPTGQLHFFKTTSEQVAAIQQQRQQQLAGSSSLAHQFANLHSLSAVASALQQQQQHLLNQHNQNRMNHLGSIAHSLNSQHRLAAAAAAAAAAAQNHHHHQASGAKRSRRELKKCRKVYGMEQRALWCTQCKWKKACSRFCDSNSTRRHHHHRHLYSQTSSAGRGSLAGLLGCQANAEAPAASA